jgi:hypothetical protein
MTERPKPEPFVPFMYQLDPALVRPKPERLERRGPREFFIVGRTRGGYATENRLSSGATFAPRMRS